MSDSRSTAENRASVLTPPGRGAIAVIAAIGPAAHAAIDQHFRAANGHLIAAQPVNRIAFGHWGDAAHAEEVIVCRQMTERLEVHCHGGVAAVTRITDALAAAGCRIIPWREWLVAEAICPIIAEADAALAKSTTRRTAAILLDQRNGALRKAIEAAQQELSSQQIEAAHARLAALLDRAELGRRLAQPWQVALAGRPNVGKSSLINAILGYQRAIVFDQPGTTRDVLAADTAIDGWPIHLTDAAGIRGDASDSIEAEGVKRARRRVQDADLVIWVLDAQALTSAQLADPLAVARAEMLAELDYRTESSIQPLVVINKCDLLPSLSPSPIPHSLFAISALHRTGLDALLAAIARRLVPNPPPPGEAVPFSRRQIELLQQAMTQLEHGEPYIALKLIHCIQAQRAGSQ